MLKNVQFLQVFAVGFHFLLPAIAFLPFTFRFLKILEQLLKFNRKRKQFKFSYSNKKVPIFITRKEKH